MNIFTLFFITFTCGFLQNVVSNANPLSYEAFFNFGDSISDTGNAAFVYGPMPNPIPYGSTYFKHPSGRMSNGRLIIDFIGMIKFFLVSSINFSPMIRIRNNKNSLHTIYKIWFNALT